MKEVEIHLMPGRSRKHETKKVEQVAMSGTPTRGGALAHGMPPDADNARNTFEDSFIHSNITFWLGNGAGAPNIEEKYPTLGPCVVVTLCGCIAVGCRV